MCFHIINYIVVETLKWEHKPTGKVFPHYFEFPKLQYECFYNVWEHRNKCFLVLLWNSRRKNVELHVGTILHVYTVHVVAIFIKVLHTVQDGVSLQWCESLQLLRNTAFSQWQHMAYSLTA